MPAKKNIKNTEPERELILDIDGLAFILPLCYKGISFAISDGYPGKTAYDKLEMKDGWAGKKPPLNEIIEKATALNYRVTIPA